MTTFNQRKSEHEILRGLLVVLFTAVTVLIGFLGVRSHQPVFMALIPAFAIGAWLLGNPTALLITMLLATRAGMLIPGLPGGLGLEHLFGIAVTGWALAHTALSKQRDKMLDASGKWLLLFLINTVLIISVRGFGISIFGGSDFGGKTYIYMTIGLLLYFSVPRVRLKEKHILILFFGGLVASAIPFLVQLSIYATGGATHFLTKFISVTSKEIMRGLEAGGDSMVRWGSVSGISGSLTSIALVIPAIRSRKVVFWGLLVVSVCLTAMTGFRGQIIAKGFVVFAWLVYDSKDRKKAFVSLMLLGLLGWLFVIAILPVLPIVAQRSLSFLPLAKERITDPMMLRAAQGSIDWRIDIWKMAWENVPRYLLIGRGLTFDVTGWAWLQAAAYKTTEFNYANHNYHSGPLSLLVDFGLPGFICATGFMISVVVQAWRGVKRFCIGRNDLISRYYVLMSIGFTWSVISYFFIFGYAPDDLARMALSAAMLIIVRRELQRTDHAVDLPAVVPVKAKPSFPRKRFSRW